MDNTTGTVLGAAAVAVALDAKDKARRAELNTFIANFDPKTASIEDKRKYADAVYEIHGTGEPMPKAMNVVLRLLAATNLLLVAIVIFGNWGNFFEMFIVSCAVTMGFWISIAIILFIAYVIRFIFTGKTE